MTPTPTLPISAENKSVAGACPLRLPAIPVTLAVPKLVVPAVEFHFFFSPSFFLCVRIAPARREVPHSHPAFQWGPGRLFHRDGARVLIDSALWISEPPRAACLLRLFSWLQMLNTRISAIPQSAMKRNVVSIVFGRLWVSSMFRCILHLPHTSADSYDFASLPTIIECFISAFLSREFFQHKRFSAGLQTSFRLKGTDLLCEQNRVNGRQGSKCGRKAEEEKEKMISGKVKIQH